MSNVWPNPPRLLTFEASQSKAMVSFKLFLVLTKAADLASNSVIVFGAAMGLRIVLNLFALHLPFCDDAFRGGRCSCADRGQCEETRNGPSGI